MQRDLARKRPAQIVAAQTAVTTMHTEVQEHHDRWALLCDVRNQERRGYVRALSKGPVFNFTMGVWEMRVVRIKQPKPAWLQVLVPAALVFVPIAVFTGAIWWFLLSLTATALIGLCGVAFLLLAGLIAVTHRRGTVVVEQIQRVTIKR